MYTIGEIIRFTLSGESHSEYIGGKLEGIPSGMHIDISEIKRDLALRKPTAGIGTPRTEDDEVEFEGGLINGITDGTPIIFKIKNKNTDSSKYKIFNETPRPGHADLPALVKFKDHEIKGGNQFSGRLTVAIVAAGNIAKQYISQYGITISAFTRSIGNIRDTDVRNISDAKGSETQPTRACTSSLNGSMTEEILSAAKDLDSVGGTVECITEGLPIGFGGIWFESLDAEIARAVFGIPACKGIEFGKGFDLGKMRGSDSNDPFYFNEGVKTRTNNMGGILGGMSDGSPMVFRVVFKPTPSIGKEQDTINLTTHENSKVRIEGRHDPCIVPRAVVVVEAMTALVIADQIRRGL